MRKRTAQSDSLTGQLLIAMPAMPDPRFARSVIFVCAHSAEGAMGLIVNRRLESLDFPSLLQQVGIEVPLRQPNVPIHFGGPVESGRGFVLHTTDYLQESTLLIAEGIGLTATVDVLRAMASGSGPRHSLLALGYAGWAAGQLDSEIQANGWLHVDADEALVFGPDIDSKWERAIKKLGIDLSLLSSDIGHA